MLLLLCLHLQHCQNSNNCLFSLPPGFSLDNNNPDKSSNYASMFLDASQIMSSTTCEGMLLSILCIKFNSLC